jgi:hypothetical protein
MIQKIQDNDFMKSQLGYHPGESRGPNRFGKNEFRLFPE